jgi:hypothetical protein
MRASADESDARALDPAAARIQGVLDCMSARGLVNAAMENSFEKN